MPHTELFPYLHLFDGRYLNPHSHLLWLETLFWLFALLLAVPLLRWGGSFARFEAAWCRLCGGNRRRKALLAMLAPALLVLLLRTALLPLIPVPAPGIHDEYSYMLGAETFAAGRVTNPTPPAWQFLETFHDNMLPSYHSMYPPAQFFFATIGILLAKNAWIGVLLGVALMCSAITWALEGWLPTRWALLGGVWAALRFGVFSYWVDAYWGGAMAALAGALVLGASARILRPCRLSRRFAALVNPAAGSLVPKIGNGLLLAIGLILLANSRPLEGLLFSLPLLFCLAVEIIGSRPGLRRKLLWRTALPAAILLLTGATWMLYYNHRTVGRWLTMPYAANFAQYHITRPFLWQARNPIPSYRHESMRSFYVIHELPDYLDSQSSWGVRLIVARNAAIIYIFFACPVGLLMLAGWRRMLRNPTQAVVAVSALFVVLPSIFELWPPHGHYLAPATSAFILIALVGLRVLRSWKLRGARFGIAVSRAVVVLMALVLAAATAAKIMDPFYLFPVGLRSILPIPMRIERERLESVLSRLDGKHLVIVSYGLKDVPSEEWVANGPDPAADKIVWARDMGAEENEKLLRAYPGRHVWSVDRSSILHPLVPYPPQALTNPLMAHAQP